MIGSEKIGRGGATSSSGLFLKKMGRKALTTSLENACRDVQMRVCPITQYLNLIKFRYTPRNEN